MKSLNPQVDNCLQIRSMCNKVFEVLTGVQGFGHINSQGILQSGPIEDAWNYDILY